ncbi:carbon-nitrogen hydrolase family protein [Arthrobacter sulfonylureivorans]|uniref:Carbon-nitrogen hydrolase family protein n=1 Tax=Arthrobacter sulfonylureivorans TaxID=2486855 RepID=A0ABY3WD24_9MICC|nr:carbon-nitrogen hydrolase family protein [Arthrobacter sulfonylureivorans]UNK47103.1 carbon-nitrogen hydrolase family protein [Arthrobacter sulfonylureivorans]
MEQLPTVSAVQAEPIWFNLAATVDKTVDLIRVASEAGSDLIAFPETWVPGYPIFLWAGDPQLRQQQLAAYMRQAISVTGPELIRIAEAARRHHILVSVSFAERQGQTLYIAQALIERDGTMAHMRRKLIMAFGRERTIFASGSIDGLRVIDTSIGRLGGLICSEHTRPRLRHELLRQGEQIHIAAWPSFALLPDVARLSAGVNMLLTQQYAAEGGNYVVAPTMVISESTQARMRTEGISASEVKVGGGHARIFSPLGEVLGAPLAPSAEGLVTASVDFDELRPIFDRDPLGVGMNKWR